MKQTLLTLALLFSAYSSFSQIKIYPKVGLVVSSQSLKFGEDVERKNWDIKNKAGYLAGVGAEVDVSQQFSLSTAVNYNTLGYIDKRQTNAREQKDKFNLNYINVPVALKYDVLRKPSSTLYVSVGAYGGLFLNGKHTSETENFYESPRYSSSEYEIGVNDRYQFDRFDFGANLGCGMEFNLLNSDFVLDATYAYGLSNVRETRKEALPRWGSGSFYWDYGTVGANGKNRFFSLSLGYVLPFKKRVT